MSEEFKSNILQEQDFGMGITSQDLTVPFYGYYNPYYFQPWKWTLDNKNEFLSKLSEDKEALKINLNVRHFAPNEIKVKVNNSEIIIEGKHEDRKDEHGYVSRQFIRKYKLPKGCESDNVTSTLSSDGILTVIARKKVDKEKDTERIVPIEVLNGITNTDFNKIENKSECTKKEECKDKCFKSEIMAIHAQNLNGTNNILNSTTIASKCSKKEEETSELAQRIINSKNKIDELLKSTADSIIEQSSSIQKDDVDSNIDHRSLLNSEMMSKNGTMSKIDIKEQADKITSGAVEMNVSCDKFEKSTMLESVFSQSCEKNETISSSMVSSSMETSFEKSSEFISESLSAELKEAAKVL